MQKTSSHTGRAWSGLTALLVVGWLLFGLKLPGLANDQAQKVAVDSAGNVYVTGDSSNGTNADYVTIKYDTNGNWLWGRRYNSPFNDHDEAASLAVDGSGNVLVTGQSWNTANWDYVTIKYNATGAWVWGARYDGPD